MKKGGAHVQAARRKAALIREEIPRAASGELRCVAYVGHKKATRPERRDVRGYGAGCRARICRRSTTTGCEMNNRKTILFVLFGACAVILLSFVGATSAGTEKYDGDVMASWLQATGSIAAIVGAYWVAEHQARQQRRQALEMDLLSRKRSFEAFRAIVENGDKCLHEVEFIGGASPTAEFVKYWEQAARRFNDAINALAAIPLHSLGSYEAVRAVVGMKDTLLAARDAVDSYVRPLDSVNPLFEDDFKGRIKQMALEASSYRNEFEVTQQGV